MATAHVCGVVGEENAEVPQLLQALVTRKPVSGSGASMDPSNLNVVTRLASGTEVTLHLKYCKTVKDLHDLNPPLVLVVFSPVFPDSFTGVKKWAAEVDRQFPRPRVCVAATRLEMLSSRKVLDQLKAAGQVASTTEEGLDLVQMFRAVSYTEVSASTATNISQLETSLAKAAISEADRRPTAELADEQRTLCIAAGSRAKRSTWIARRDTDKTNRIYYFNLETKTSQWTRPKDFDGEEPDMTEEERRAMESERVMDEEKRRKREREAEKAASYMRDVSQHDDKMRDLEAKRDLLDTQIITYQAELKDLKDQQARCAREREILEVQRDEDLGRSSALVTKTADDEAQLEKELQTARAKAFQLEAAAAMRLERDFDVQIAEAVMRNRSLAARLRAFLQEQLDIQRDGAATQAKRAAIQKRKEDATRTLAKLQHTLTARDREKAVELDALKDIEARSKAVEAELHALLDKERDVEYASKDQLAQQKNLIKACDELQANIDAMRIKMAKSGKAQVQQETQRLRLEQRNLVQRLATVEAARARSEVLVRKLIINHQHMCDERRVVEDRLLGLAQRRCKAAQKALATFEEGLGYSGVSKEELERLAASFEGSQQLGRQANTNEVASALRNKLRLMEKGAELKAMSKQFGEFLRARRGDVTSEEKKENDVNGWIVETFESLEDSNSTSNAGQNAIASLVARARACLVDDPKLIDVLTSTFAKEVAAPDSSKSHSLKRRVSSSATRFDPEVSFAQLSEAEKNVRRSYAHLANRLAGDIANR